MKMTKILFAVFLSASVLFMSCSPKDPEIQTKIAEKFAANPDLTGATATVTDGVATLTGEVKNDAAKGMAEADAKEVKGVKSVVNNITTTPTVMVAPDATLMQGVTDATKDFPGVTGMVNNGEITLTGELKRDDLQKLMQSLQSLNPTKINNNLTLK